MLTVREPACAPKNRTQNVSTRAEATGTRDELENAMFCYAAQMCHYTLVIRYL